MSTIKSVAITGKGGTGKTMIATLMIKQLAEKYKGKKILAIDADSAMSLPYTLGIKVNKTVSQLRKEVVGPGETKEMMKNGTLKQWISQLVTHADGFDLMVMGRPEAPGCFCSVNDLLRYSIGVLTEDYDVVIIDGEAGPEQINRRVLTKVDKLLVVADMSVRSLETAAGIIEVANSKENEIRIGSVSLLLNRIRDDKPDEERVKKTGAEVLGYFPEDPVLNKFDREGRSLLELPDDCACVQAVCDMLGKLFPDFKG